MFFCRLKTDPKTVMLVAVLPPYPLFVIMRDFGFAPHPTMSHIVAPFCSPRMAWSAMSSPSGTSQRHLPPAHPLAHSPHPPLGLTASYLGDRYVRHGRFYNFCDYHRDHSLRVRLYLGPSRTHPGLGRRPRRLSLKL